MPCLSVFTSHSFTGHAMPQLDRNNLSDEEGDVLKACKNSSLSTGYEAYRALGEVEGDLGALEMQSY